VDHDGPLVVLGLLSAVGGVLNVPELYHGGAWLHHWLEPVTQASAALVSPPEAHLSPSTSGCSSASRWRSP